MVDSPAGSAATWKSPRLKNDGESNEASVRLLNETHPRTRHSTRLRRIRWCCRSPTCWPKARLPVKNVHSGSGASFENTAPSAPIRIVHPRQKLNGAILRSNVSFSVGTDRESSKDESSGRKILNITNPVNLDFTVSRIFTHFFGDFSDEFVRT